MGSRAVRYAALRLVLLHRLRTEFSFRHTWTVPARGHLVAGDRRTFLSGVAAGGRLRQARAPGEDIARVHRAGHRWALLRDVSLRERAQLILPHGRDGLWRAHRLLDTVGRFFSGETAEVVASG